MGGWRLTWRGEIVFGGLGVLLLAAVGSVVDGPVTELARRPGSAAGPARSP